MLFQHLGNGESIRAARHAFPAFGAIPDRLHVLCREPCSLGAGHPAGNYRVVHRRGDHNPLLTGLAVLTPATELLSQFLAVSVHGGKIFGEDLVFGFIQGGDLIDLLDGIETGQRNHVGILAKEFEAQFPVIQSSPSEGLHGENAHSCLPGVRMEFLEGLVFDEVEGKLDSAEKPRLHQFHGHLDTVGSHADVPDLAGLLRAAESLHDPVGPGCRLVVVLQGELVYLKQVDIVGTHAFQAQIDIRLGAGGVALRGFGGDNQAVSDAVESPPYLLLAVQVHVGGVEQGYPSVISPSENSHGLLGGKTDDRNTPETHFRDFKPCFPKYLVLHCFTPSFITEWTVIRSTPPSAEG